MLRKYLTSDRIYYVSTTGSDSNNGLTLKTAFATATHAYNLIATTLDFGGNNVTIQIADGAYNIASAPWFDTSIGQWVGGGSLILQGNLSDTSAVVVHDSGQNYAGVFGAVNNLFIKNITFSGTASAIYGIGAGNIYCYNLKFINNHNDVTSDASGNVISLYESMTWESNSSHPITANYGGKVFVYTDSITAVGGNVPVSSAFVTCINQGYVEWGNPVVSGTFTGQRYEVTTQSLIQTFGAGANTLPGDSPGVADAATLGLYL